MHAFPDALESLAVKQQPQLFPRSLFPLSLFLFYFPDLISTPSLSFTSCSQHDEIYLIANSANSNRQITLFLRRSHFLST